MAAETPSLDTIFCAAVEMASADDRAAYIARTCGDDRELQAQVEKLVEAHFRAGSFLEQPAPQRLAEELAAGAATAATQGEPPAGGAAEEELSFLTPADKPDVLGRLGHYDILEVVGRGGMGVVLRAFDAKLHRVVAIKVMAAPLATSATARKRFAREAQAQAAVSHDHVVTIHAVEEANGLPYLVMQYVAGVSLQERLNRGGPLALHEVLRIGMQTAAGLAAAHAQGLVHRDVKPANILLENGVERVKLTDFGLARAADDASLTQSGVVAGTPHYMSPEQARGERLEPRSDLFSLGSVLYAMCTGRLPFRAAGSMAVLRRVCDETPTPVREINPEVPDWLAAIIEKLHAKDPAGRYQSAAEVAELLGQHLAHVQHPSVMPAPAVVAESGDPATTRRRRGRGRRWFAAAVAVTLGMLGVGGYLLAPTALHVVADQGELVIETDAPDVEVIVKQGGEQVKIIGAKTQHEVNLKAGSYQLELAPGKKGLSLSPNHVTLQRGGKEVVKVRLEPMIAARPPATDLFKDAVLHMTFEKDTFYEKEGKTYVRDLSGRGNDGLCDNVAFTPDGKTGGGLLCQGGKLQLAKSLIDRQPNYTITAWCRCQKSGPADADQHLYLAATPEKLNQACFDAYFPPERRCFVNAWNADLPEYWRGANAGGSTVPAGWFFVAIALTDGETGKGKLRIVIDDRIHARTSQIVAVDGAPQLVDAVGYNMNGVIDELAVFQRALSDAEIQAIRQRGIGGDRNTQSTQPAPPPSDFTNSIGMKLKLIKPGTFTMGSPKVEEDHMDNEGPQHEVEITKAFYMGAYPVTKGQFAAFVQDDGYQTEAEKDGKGGWHLDLKTGDWEQKPEYTWRHPGSSEGDDYPVVMVSWNDATAFCAWLSKREGKTYELPTEAEWEYACRAGTKTRFWCGDADASLEGNANIADASLKAKCSASNCVAWDDGYAFTSPMRSFKANPWGLYDMHGNVWQWNADGYDNYQEGSIKDPKGKEGSNSRVLRGGAWDNVPWDCRSAVRRGFDPGHRGGNFGFRVVSPVSAWTP